MGEQRNETLKYALHYQKCGLSIFPVKGPRYAQGISDEEKAKDSKAPLIKWSPYQKRQPTETEVREWLRRWPEANLACITGAISSVVTVDFDSEEAVEFAKKRDLLNTPLVRTRRGMHAYYRYAGEKRIRNSVNASLKIDIKGEGGNIILPPSVHYSGKRYEWVTGHVIGKMKMSDLPEVFIEMAAPVCGGDDRVRQLYFNIGDGERNTSLARLCGFWIKHGFSYEECLTQAHAWNSFMNPSLAEEEIEATVRSIMRYHAQTRRSGFVKGSELLKAERKEEEEGQWLLEGIAKAKSVGLVYGGKTDAVNRALQVAMAMATGVKYQQKKTQNVDRVWLVSKEGEAEIHARIKEYSERILGKGLIGSEELTNNMAKLLVASSKGIQPGATVNEIKNGVASAVHKQRTVVIIDRVFDGCGVESMNTYICGLRPIVDEGCSVVVFATVPEEKAMLVDVDYRTGTPTRARNGDEERADEGKGEYTGSPAENHVPGG